MICSISRFVSLVQTKATTSPTFDPTWYGSTAIVLSILEVDIATTMASLPVFWPYIRRNIDNGIMITHEVKITEHFAQIKGDQAPAETAGYSHWVDTSSQTPDSTMVMMKDLSRLGTTRGSGNHEVDLPFDGSRSPEPRSSSRQHILGRESKEVLLR